MKFSIALIALLILTLYAVFAAMPFNRVDAYPNYFHVLESEFELGAIQCGSHLVEIPILNQSSMNRRVLGVEAWCYLGCCCEPANGDGTLEIGAGQTHLLAITLTVKSPGPFSLPVTFYLEDKGTRTITVTISGMGIGDAIPSEK